MKPSIISESSTSTLPSMTFVEIVLFLLGFSICFQNITLFSVQDASIKPYHLVTLALLVLSFAQRGNSWRFPSNSFSLVMLLVLTISLVDSFRFGLSTIFFNYVFFFIVIAVVYNIGMHLSIEQWRRIVQRIALLFIAILFVHISLNYRFILNFFADPWGGHPTIPTFFGGGPNLEASWLALFGVFFERDFKGNVFLGGSLIVSAMYASRAGMVLSILAFLYVYVIQPKDWSFLKRITVLTFVGAVVFAVLSAFGGIILDRFLSIGEERGSLARFDMWQYAATAFFDSPVFGNGAGNAVRHVNDVSGAFFGESNIHNYFLQVLLDFGVIGFAVYMLMIARLLKSAGGAALC